MFPLHTLRGLAQGEMGAVRRSGTSLVLTRTGRLMTEDRETRWRIGTAALVGADDGTQPDFAVAVREAGLLFLLVSGPAGYEELTRHLTRIHTEEGLDRSRRAQRRRAPRDPRAPAPAVGPAPALHRACLARAAHAHRDRGAGGAVRAAVPGPRAPAPRRPRLIGQGRVRRGARYRPSDPGRRPGERPVCRRGTAAGRGAHAGGSGGSPPRAKTSAGTRSSSRPASWPRPATW